MSCIRQWIFCFLLLLLSGCAQKLPQTVAVSGLELDQVQERLSRFLDQSCVTAIDSDVRLKWRAYGQQETYPAILQAMAGGFIRFAVVDPLGRPLLLLAVSDNSFTLADNAKSIGYRGRVDSEFIHDYLPEFIAANDLFYWLSGRVRQDQMRVLSARKDAAAGSFFWYEVDYGDNLTHLLGLDSAEHLDQHLVLDRNDSIIFAARYSGYSATTMDNCAWPGKIEISGEELAAEFTLEFTKVYSFLPLEKQIFQLQLPSHFTVHEIK